MRDRVVRTLAAGAASAALGGLAEAAPGDEREAALSTTWTTGRTGPTTIRLRLANGMVVAATLLDNPTARDFAAQLPMTLTLTDYAATEKIADLPGGLPTEGAPDGYEPKAGDLAYYAPWGNLAVFHRPFRYSAKLIRLGTIDGDVALFAVVGPMSVTIEPAE